MSRTIVLNLLAQTGLLAFVAFFTALFIVSIGLLVRGLRRTKEKEEKGALDLLVLVLIFEVALGCVLLGLPFAVVYRRWSSAGDVGAMSLELIMLLVPFGFGILYALLARKKLQGGREGQDENREASHG
jgi:hypothetical protein